MSRSIRRLVGWARQGLLTGGAVLGIVCILMTLGAALFGLRPLVFESGSMSPTIRTGDLAISRDVPASDLRRGDIVSVPTGTGSRVTHRVVSVTREGSDAVLRLRGDANTATDATPYRVSHADRVLFHVPRLGYVVGWLSGPLGLFLLGLYAAFLLAVLVKGSPAGAGPVALPVVQLSSEERVIPPSRGGRRKAARRSRRRTMLSGGLSVAVLAGVVTGAAAQRSVTPTLAAWYDPVPITGTRLTASTVPPTVLSCVKSGSSAIFTWSAVSNATNYTISFSGGAAKNPVSVPDTTYTDTTPSTDRVATVVANMAFAGVTWTSVASNPRTETFNNGKCS